MMAAVTRLRPSQHDSSASGSDWLPHLEPRTWECKYEGYETARMFGCASKLILRFSIAEIGDFYGHKLLAYYNAERLTTRAGKSGGFKVGFHSDFLRTFVKLFGAPSERRTDRLPMSRFDGKFFRCKVRSVDRDSKQQEIPPELRYSIIRSIESMMT